jgi:polyisoprenoid-binding protein YceI
MVAATLGAIGAATAAPLQIDMQQSRIAVQVKATVNFTGELQKYDVKIDCDNHAALPGRADVSFDFKDLKTGKDGRDKDMLKWLEYTNFPTATFHLTGWRQDGANNVALGDFTLHGVTKSIEMPATVTHQGQSWDITGEAPIDYQDFKLPHIRKALMFSVDPKLKVTFHIVGKTQ